MTGMTFRRIGAIALSFAVFAMVSAPADARRGGSFGSRGARTHAAPPPTATAPQQAAPVQKTMADRPAPGQAQPAAAARQAAPTSAMAGKSGGLAKGLIGGLVAGGLIGMLLGNGFGALNGEGLMMALLQILMIGGLVWLAFRLFRRRPAFAPAGAGAPGVSTYDAHAFAAGQTNAPHAASPMGAHQLSSSDLAITMADKEQFEQLLYDVQDAFGQEDYARLRSCTTPEVMSYLAEELSQNATRGLRNRVTGTELVAAEVAEAWSEGTTDYATIAMRYQSIDVMVDRNSDAVVEGDPTQPTLATELWTFVRDPRNAWRLSAIQTA